MLLGLARRAANKSRKHQYFTPLSVDSRTVSLTRPVQESEWERTSARPDSQRVTPPLQSGCAWRRGLVSCTLQNTLPVESSRHPGLTSRTSVSALRFDQVLPTSTGHLPPFDSPTDLELCLTTPDPCWWQTAGEGEACHSEWCSRASALPCPRRSRRPTWAGTVR